ASPTRALEFSSLMQGKKINWWAEGRVDTLNRYTDGELQLLRDGGCRLVFMGAESGDNEILQRYRKGETFRAPDTLTLAARFRKAGIIPELSFVLGFPEKDLSLAWEKLQREIRFIRELKAINPAAEVILYVYSPVPGAGSGPDEIARQAGLEFPKTLEEWLEPEWKQFDLRKDPGTPWFTPQMARYVKNVKTVLDSAFPSVSDFRLRGIRKRLLTLPGKVRYRLGWYRYPLELQFLQKILNYLPPEKEGFYAEECTGS
ncbi:MAG TPA: hypothetical protein VMC08_11235, partial [Bacteroidales bacterium]|nr:hypothetical protein [Bacteroidales bacterium]